MQVHRARKQTALNFKCFLGVLDVLIQSAATSGGCQDFIISADILSHSISVATLGYCEYK